jgi:hypothetical protein
MSARDEDRKAFQPSASVNVRVALFTPRSPDCGTLVSALRVIVLRAYKTRCRLIPAAGFLCRFQRNDVSPLRVSGRPSPLRLWNPALGVRKT